MTTARTYADSEGDFAQWQDHPRSCAQLVVQADGAPRACGAVVRVRIWESHDGAYEDAQYRCAAGHTWWIDGIDS